jgi:hypothetical protein
MKEKGHEHFAGQHLSLLVRNRGVEENEFVEAGSGNLMSFHTILLCELERF